jgi:hypothetical protein
LSLDKFPEAFERFERTVNIKDIKSFPEFVSAFESWQGYMCSLGQRHALALEARRLNIPVESVMVRRARWVRAEQRWREREFSVMFPSFSSWQEKPSRSSAYQKRIENYMKSHPNATLSEARGHKHKGR